ncbi:unnamed protein product [Caenorhabditis nigoni]
MPTTGSYLHWITISHAVPQIGFFASIGLGLTVLCLNFCGAQKNFGSYKYIVNSFTILGMIFAISEVLVYPNVHNYNAGFLFFTIDEPFGVVDLNLRTMLLAGFTFSYVSTMSLLATQFIYRYWGIFDVEKLRFFSGIYWLIWPLFCLIFALEYAWGAFYFYKMDSVSMEYFREEIQYRYDWNISEIPAVALVAYDPCSEMIRWNNVAGILNIRISAPTILLFTPNLVIILLPLFNPQISIPSGALLCSFTLYPAMDSIIVIWFMPYGIILAVLYCLFHTVYWTIFCWLYIGGDLDRRLYIRETMLEHHGVDVMNMTIIIAQYFEGTPQAMSKSRIGIGSLSVLSIISLVFIFYFGYKICHKLSSQSLEMSEKTKKLQTQLMKALVVQAAIPTCVSFAPCLFAWYQPVFGLDLGRWIQHAAGIAVATFPALDPLALIFFVPTFRRKFAEYFLFVRSCRTNKTRCSQQATTSTSQSRIDK